MWSESSTEYGSKGVSSHLLKAEGWAVRLKSAGSYSIEIYQRWIFLFCSMDVIVLRTGMGHKNLFAVNLLYLCEWIFSSIAIPLYYTDPDIFWQATRTCSTHTSLDSRECVLSTKFKSCTAYDNLCGLPLCEWQFILQGHGHQRWQSQICHLFRITKP